MRKITTVLVLLLNLTILLPAQDYIRKREKKDANFYEVQKSFNDLWEGREYEKGKGYKQFKRWEYLMEQRVGADGKIPNIASSWLIKKEHEKQQRLLGKRRAAVPKPNWNSLGPATWTNGNDGYNPGNGRINAVAADPNNPNRLFVGTPAGGYWESNNGGNSWTPKGDDLAVLGVSDILVDHTNSNIMYILTGDNDGGNTNSIGILKSTDGGDTWNTTGLVAEVTDGWDLNKMVMHPSDPNTIIVAGDIGVYKTTNGGDNWSLVLPSGGRNYGDVMYKPTDPSIVYVSTKGSGNIFFKSTNGGDSFSAITTGLPSTNISRTVIGVSAANPNYVYLLLANSSSSFRGVYRSEDSGESFSLKASSPNILGYSPTGSDGSGQGWYDLCIAVSPTDAETIFTGGIHIWKSTDGGETYDIQAYWVYDSPGYEYVHADVHTLEYVGNTLYTGCDGGIFRTTNDGDDWTDLSASLEIMQFYRIGGLADNPDLVIGGAQDNGGNLYNAAVGWTHVYGADGMEALIDYSNNNIMYESVQFGVIQRSMDGGQNFTNISPTSGGAWVTPYVIDPQVPTTLYAGYDEVYKTTNRGSSWNQISNLNIGTLRSLEVAPSNPDYLYTATYSSIYVTKNGGSSWTNIKSGLPSQSITYITIATDDPEKVWVTFSGYSANNKVYYSENAGESWTNITGDLPNLPVNCVTYQKDSPNRVFVGTDVGVYYKDDSSPNWNNFSEGLPNVMVHEMEINYSDNKLRAGTHGRGLWEADLPQEVPITYINVAQESGIDFTYGTGTMGGGASFADFNGDGKDDISITSEGGQPVGFYANTGDGYSITQFNGINDESKETKQVTWVDFDNDGDKDVFITHHIDGSNKLYRNDGSGNFTDITAQAGIITDEMPTFGVAWGDINNDGWLDLYLTNRSGLGETYFNYLYKNKGDGTFEDITISAGVKDEGNLPFLAGFLDINNDGWLDIYIPQDKNYGNVLFKNNGDETFTDISASSGADLIMEAMSITVGDYDNNGYLDIYMTNTEDGNKLLRNNGDETFTEVSEEVGVSYDAIGWGSNFVDYDNDGDLDLFAVGMIEREPANQVMYENDGTGHFIEKMDLGFDGIQTKGFGMAMGDPNNDGFYDFLVVNENPDKVQLWESSGNNNNWVKVKLQGKTSNREGLGNWIDVYADGNKYSRYTTLEASYVSQNSSDIIIGIGEATEIDSIEVRWLGGNISKRYNVAVNEKITIVENQEYDPLTFTNVAVEKGINNTYGVGIQGGGIAFTDFNNDGLDDIAMPRGNGLATSFYANNGNGFDSLAVPVAINTNKAIGKQVLWADYDNDGDKDLFLASYTEGNRLYRNDGNFDFTDVTAQAGITLDPIRSYGGAWGDINNDGFLDLYITDSEGDENPNYTNFLYKNNGDGTFTDITTSSGTADNGDKLPLVPAFLDINNDGFVDIYIAQDRRKKNTLLRNNGDETFTDISESSGANIEMDGMCIAIGDYDKNGYLDMYISNIPTAENIPNGGNRLLRNNGNETFTDVTSAAGVEYEAVGWGGNFIDYDNDGDLDIFAVGATEREGSNEVLYENNGQGVFTENTSLGFDGIQTISFGTAIGDFNNDGFYDIVVNNDSPDHLELWENSGNNNNWLKVSLEGSVGNRDGFGSWIEVYCDDEKFPAYATNAVSYNSQNSSDIIIGIGQNSAIDSVQVTWLSGLVNTIYNPEVNQKIHVVENNNAAPVFTSSPILEVQEGDAYLYEIEVADANNDVLSFTSSALPEWLTFSNTSQGLTLSGTPQLENIGVFDITLTASDGQAEVSQIFQITVNPKPIAKPTNFEGEVISAKQTYFTWQDNSNNEGNFEVQRSATSTFNSYSSKIVEANEEAYLDKNLIPNFQYYYRLRAINPHTESDFTETVMLITPDSVIAPSDLEVLSYSHHEVVLKWKDKSDNETGFELYYDTNESFEAAEKISINAGEQQHTVSGLNRNSMYYFKINAFNENTSSSFSDAVNQQTNDYIETPTSVTIIQSNNLDIQLDWDDNSPNETGFEIQRSLTEDFVSVSTFFVESNITSFTDAGLSFDETYYYRVKGYNDNLSSEFSEAVHHTITDFVAAPSDLSGDVMSSTELQLQWVDNADNETAFELLKSLTNDFAENTLIDLAGNETTYTDAGLDPNTTYFYKIRGKNENVNSEYSETLSITTNDTIMAPDNLQVTEFTDTEISLSWSDNSDNETGFTIYRSTNADFSNPTTVSTTNADVVSYKDSELDDNTTYYYKVHAVNSNTASEYTAVVSSTTLVTGLDIDEIKGDMKVFPNPFSEKIRVHIKNADLGPVTLRLLDISGKQLNVFTFNKKSRSFDKTLNLQLDKGVYLLEIRQGANRSMRKVVRN